MLIKSLRSVHNVADLEELKRWTAVALEEIQNIVNGKLEFIVNIKSQSIQASFVSANTDLTLSHGLGKTPIGAILIRSSAAMALYDGTVSWNENSICLKSNAVGDATILVF